MMLPYETKRKYGKLAFKTLLVVGILIFSVPFIAPLVKNAALKNLSEEDGVAAAVQRVDGQVASVSDENPAYYYFTKNPDAEVKVSASAFLVGDLNTGEVILSKNQDKSLPIASVSKLMTALVAGEIVDKDDTAQVSKRALDTYGSNGDFHVGEKIKTKDLIYPLLLESSNDAAEILAEHFGRDAFIRKMNQQAEILTMSKTSYEDPSGLSKNNQSTPEDLFKLAGFLMKERADLIKLTTKRSYSTKTHNWPSTNQFLNVEGYLGGKSGFTDPAKETLVSLFSLPLSKEGTRPVAIILLHSSDRYKDVQTILKFLKKNIYYGGLADANTDWVKKKIGLPDIKDPDFVTFSFLGDIMVGRGVRSSVIKNFKGDYAALFEKLDILKKSDIVFANLEGPVSDLGEDTRNIYSFRMDPAVIPALAGAGINVVSVTNNHMGDWGLEAYKDTLARLLENEIFYTGGGMNRLESEEPAILEKYGLKIGFLGFSDKGPEFLKAENYQAGVLLTSNPRFDQIIENASAKVDYLVVSFHFGEEYQKKHNIRQEELAHRAIDDGAKIVIGSHPHVVQDFEVYDDGYIAYSLGNFIFDQNFSKDTMQGGLLEVKLARDGSMLVRKSTVKLNSAFQPDQVIRGNEEKINFTR